MPTFAITPQLHCFGAGVGVGFSTLEQDIIPTSTIVVKNSVFILLLFKGYVILGRVYFVHFKANYTQLG